jgi:cell division protein DivIC
MKLIKIFKNRKLFLLNIFLTIYVATNFVGGERGLLSYIEKKNIEKKLINSELVLSIELKELENKNKLLSENIDLDYLDIIYREKLKLGKKNEIIIKLK